MVLPVKWKLSMELMAKIGEINVLVGEEVAGAISAELIDVPWDKAFQALLDMKNYAADIDVGSNLIRVHAPATLTAQENYKSARATAVRKKLELEESFEQIKIAGALAAKTLDEVTSFVKPGIKTYTPGRASTLTLMSRNNGSGQTPTKIKINTKTPPTVFSTGLASVRCSHRSSDSPRKVRASKRRM
mgnify:CR=1 FL=1